MDPCRSAKARALWSTLTPDERWQICLKVKQYHDVPCKKYFNIISIYCKECRQIGVPAMLDRLPPGVKLTKGDFVIANRNYLDIGKEIFKREYVSASRVLRLHWAAMVSLDPVETGPAAQNSCPRNEK